ncbi:MAG: hypothetical protein WC668_00555 [Patescibacteria group bacterium]|jgi:hypothetical protein
MLIFLSYALLFTALGIFWFGIDKYFGVVVFSFVYNLTHSKRLPADRVSGFILGRKARGRFYSALLLGFVNWRSCLYFMTHGPVVNSFLLLLAVVFTMVGFYCGPMVMRLLGRRDQLLKHLDVIDQIEAGEIQVGDEAKKKAKSWWKNLKGGLADWKSALRDAINATKNPEQAAVIDTAPAETEEMPATAATELSALQQELAGVQASINLMGEQAKTAPSNSNGDEAIQPPNENHLKKAKACLEKFSRGEDPGLGASDSDLKNE